MRSAEYTLADDFDSEEQATDTERTTEHRGALRAALFGSLAFFAVIAALASRITPATQEVASIQSAITLDDAAAVPEVRVYPVRFLFFRHGFSCTNALSAAGCADPDAPILNLSEADQTALFDTLDSIATQFPAPRRIPLINRSYGIQGRGRKYLGGDPPRPEGYLGDDCMFHLQPRSNDSQWHEMGDVIQLRHFYRDPVLNACSKFQVKKAGDKFRAWLKQEGIKLDFLGASMLIRTFQSAYWQLLSDRESWSEIFAEEMLEGGNAPNVSQLPFVNEFDEVWGYQADDYAWGHKEQREVLSSAMGEDQMAHLDYSQLSGFTEDERRDQNWETFKARVLGQRLGPSLLRRQGEPVPATITNVSLGDPFQDWSEAAVQVAGVSGKVGATLNLAMASHSGVIHHACGNKVGNYAAQEMLLLLEVHSTGKVVVHQKEGECNEVMTGMPHPHTMYREDIANCKGPPFDVTQAFTPRKSGDGLTPCEEMAVAEDAFKTTPATLLQLEERRRQHKDPTKNPPAKLEQSLIQKILGQNQARS